MGNSMRWMVCTASGVPSGLAHMTPEEAEEALRAYPPGCDYHVRPVELVVRGQPPAPWFHRVHSPARDGEGRGAL